MTVDLKLHLLSVSSRQLPPPLKPLGLVLPVGPLSTYLGADQVPEVRGTGPEDMWPTCQPPPRHPCGPKLHLTPVPTPGSVTMPNSGFRATSKDLPRSLSCRSSAQFLPHPNPVLRLDHCSPPLYLRDES